jgi:archaellum component FlaC
MADVTNELIYEVLKAMQQRLANIEAKIGEVDGRMHALTIRMDGLRTEVGAAHAGIENIYQTLAHSDGRLARIEKRLDLVHEHVE